MPVRNIIRLRLQGTHACLTLELRGLGQEMAQAHVQLCAPPSQAGSPAAHALPDQTQTLPDAGVSAEQVPEAVA